MSGEAVARGLRLSPHPYEGWFRETDHAAGRFRSFLWLIEGGNEAAWHRLPADVVWSFESGAPLALSRSEDGVGADAVHLGPSPGSPHSAVVREGTYQALDSLGAWTLLRGTLVPDAELSDRALTPETWFPGSQA